MTKIECPTCEGEGKIYERRVDNRNEEEETQEPSLLDVKAYPTLNGLFGRYEEEEEVVNKGMEYPWRIE